MKNKKHVRNFSLLLCAALLAGQMGMTVYAEETSSGNRGGGKKTQKTAVGIGNHFSMQ